MRHWFDGRVCRPGRVDRRKRRATIVNVSRRAYSWVFAPSIQPVSSLLCSYFLHSKTGARLRLLVHCIGEAARVWFCLSLGSCLLFVRCPLRHEHGHRLSRLKSGLMHIRLEARQRALSVFVGSSPYHLYIVHVLGLAGNSGMGQDSTVVSLIYKRNQWSFLACRCRRSL